METFRLIEKAQKLTDLELAMLLSFMAEQHCIIESEQANMESLEQELKLVW